MVNLWNWLPSENSQDNGTQKHKKKKLPWTKLTTVVQLPCWQISFELHSLDGSLRVQNHRQPTDTVFEVHEGCAIPPPPTPPGGAWSCPTIESSHSSSPDKKLGWFFGVFVVDFSRQVVKISAKPTMSDVSHHWPLLYSWYWCPSPSNDQVDLFQKLMPREPLSQI